MKGGGARGPSAEEELASAKAYWTNYNQWIGDEGKSREKKLGDIRARYAGQGKLGKILMDAEEKKYQKNVEGLKKGEHGMALQKYFEKQKQQSGPMSYDEMREYDARMGGDSGSANTFDFSGMEKYLQVPDSSDSGYRLVQNPNWVEPENYTSRSQQDSGFSWTSQERKAYYEANKTNPELNKSYRPQSLRNEQKLAMESQDMMGYYQNLFGALGGESEKEKATAQATDRARLSARGGMWG